MRKVWSWQDGVLAQEELEDNLSRLDLQLDNDSFLMRRDWWEEMVEEIERTEGRLSLS